MSEAIESEPSGEPAIPSLPRQEEELPGSNLVDLLLRSPRALLGRFDEPDASKTLVRLAAVALAGHLIYGFVVASFAGDMQWWAAPLKILFGITLSGAICFPSLYILVCLSGARARGPQVAGMLLSLLALSAVFLAGFAPIAWVFSQSSNLVSFIGPVHLLVWFISLFASVHMLSLGMKHWRARGTGWVGMWILVLVVTALQMATVLRPIVGPSTQFLETERQFFLQHWLRTIEGDA
ncbi:MAG: hypothetical protein ABIP42_06515, partial [Planctomycetota bacterium]